MKINLIFIVICLTLANSLALKLKLEEQLELETSSSSSSSSSQETYYNYFRTGYLAGQNTDKWKQENMYSLTDEEFVEKIKGTETKTGYCEKHNIDLSNFSNNKTCQGVKNNISFEIGVRFCVKKNDKIKFRGYHDFGAGSLIQLNGQTVFRFNQDVWWGGSNLNNVSSHFEMVAEKKRIITILVVGGEICCDGNQKLLISVNDEQFTVITDELIRNKCEEADLVDELDDLPPIDPYPVC